MQVRDLAAGCPIGLIACGFSPPEALAALAEYLRWPGLFLADEQRLLYTLLGMRRASLWQVYSPGTLARYALAAARGHRLWPPQPRPVEDTRQMGGDALVHGASSCAAGYPAPPTTACTRHACCTPPAAPPLVALQGPPTPRNAARNDYQPSTDRGQLTWRRSTTTWRSSGRDQEG